MQYRQVLKFALNLFFLFDGILYLTQGFLLQGDLTLK
jgi:hypothetical protein